MPLNIPKPVYELPNAGRHMATLVDVYDEEKDGMKGKYHVFTFAWELGTKRKNGEPFWIRASYGPSRSPKSNLVKMLTGWMERTLTSEEFDTFNVEDLVGKAAEVVVVHKESASGIWANISTVLAFPADRTAPKPSGEYRRKVANDPNLESPAWVTDRD
jgi:hypothetical protein